MCGVADLNYRSPDVGQWHFSDLPRVSTYVRNSQQGGRRNGPLLRPDENLDQVRKARACQFDSEGNANRHSRAFDTLDA